MKYLTLLLSLVVLGSTGCICTTTIHPLLTEKDHLHDSDLSGTWHQVVAKGKQPQVPDFTCEGWDKNACYDVTIALPKPEAEAKAPRGKELPTRYDMVAGKIGDLKLLQIRRSELDTGGPSFYEGVVAYTFARFELKDDQLLIYPIDNGSLERWLPKSDIHYLMHKPDDWAQNIVLTDSTPELQAFVKQHHDIIFIKAPLQFERSKETAAR